MTSALSLKFMAALLVATFAPAAFGGQLTGKLSGPVLGYFFDSSDATLRPIRGIPGSTTVDAPLNTGFVLSQVLVLDATHLIASTDDVSELVTLNLETTPVSTFVISGAPKNPSLEVASLEGTAAAFYYADAREVRIVTGLPQSPTLAHTIDLHHIGRLTNMAVSDAGTMLAYSVNDERTETLYSWTSSLDDRRWLSSANAISSLAITGNGDLIVADRGANEIFEIRDVAGAAIRQFIAGAREGISDPAGLGIAVDNRVFIGNAGSATVTTLDPNGRFLGTQNCHCDLSGIYALRESVFRLTDRVHQTIYLLDAGSVEARILFVPPAKDRP